MRSEVSGNPCRSQSVKKKRKAMALNVARVGSGVLGAIRGYTAYTNLRDFFDSVYSPR